jgi:hypothetical protein
VVIDVERMYYRGKASGYAGTMLSGLVRDSGVDHDPETLVVWDETGNRKKRDRVWLDWPDDLATQEVTLPQAGDKVTVNTAGVLAPVTVWEDDGAGTAAFGPTGFATAVRLRKVDDGADVELTPYSDYEANGAAGRVEIADSVLGVDNTKLTSAMDADDTTAAIEYGLQFPATGRVLIDSELIDYTGRIETTLNGLTRGANGTTAAEHSIGRLVEVADPGGKTLAAGIDDNDGSLTLSPHSDGMPDFGMVLIGTEKLGYSGTDGDTLLWLRRGALGSTAAAHLSGAGVE